jgi:MFS family permease
MLGLTRYQWLVLFAAWLGWGFDVFDGLLFNYVAPICVPNLLGLKPGDPSMRAHTLFWTGLLTSVLLFGWALGGILFGKITDRLGRTRTLLLTMLTYALATAACAFAPNLLVLGVFRFIASLGIGGEWAAGATLVAETMPEEKRVQGGALLYTSAPAGILLATYVNDLFTRKLEVIAHNPNLSWRVVFLTGLVPALAALAIRMKVKEPAVWRPQSNPSIRELFNPEFRRRTLGGLALALIALVSWWSCSAFIPVVANFLVGTVKLSARELATLKTQYITLGTTAFAIGGLIGTLLTATVAVRFGRRPMFLCYYLVATFCILASFGLDLEPKIRLLSLFGVGLSVFGVFGSFTFYLPELFPVRMRGTGSGFCYNAGRLLTLPFPFAVGYVARTGKNPLDILIWVALAPAIGVLLLLLGVGVETRQRVAD